MSHPVGSFQAVVLMATATEAQSGTPGLAIKFETEAGTITETKWITPNTIEYVHRDLDTLGISQKRLESLTNFESICEALVGAKCEIVIEEGEYKGKPQLRVKYINAPAQQTGDAAERAFGLLTGKPMAARSGPVSQPRPRPVATTPELDSDVPF